MTTSDLTEADWKTVADLQARIIRLGATALSEGNCRLRMFLRRSEPPGRTSAGASGISGIRSSRSIDSLTPRPAAGVGAIQMDSAVQLIPEIAA
jgi:hypothetical protein